MGGFSAEQLFWEGNIHDLRVHGPQGSESLGRPYRTSLVTIAQEAPINPRCFIAASRQALTTFH